MRHVSCMFIEEIHYIHTWLVARGRINPWWHVWKPYTVNQRSISSWVSRDHQVVVSLLFQAYFIKYVEDCKPLACTTKLTTAVSPVDAAAAFVLVQPNPLVKIPSGNFQPNMQRTHTGKATKCSGTLWTFWNLLASLVTFLNSIPKTSLDGWHSSCVLWHPGTVSR